MRQDWRSLDTFKKDILFTTKIETWFWYKYIETIPYDSISYEDYGTDNTGEYKESASDKPDYKITYILDGEKCTELMEIKFAPTAGKLTFKVDNLNSYIKHSSSILLFYNVGSKDLKKPKDYDLKKHIELLESNIKDLRWGIITVKAIKKMLKEEIQQKVYYMGNKNCVIITEDRFSNYFLGMKL